MTDIYVVGYPKTGTTWLCRLLADSFDSPVGGINKESSNKDVATEGSDRPGSHYIGHGHPVPVYLGSDAPLTDGHLRLNMNALTDERIVFITRRPRDVAVSASHHWDMSLEKAIECMRGGIFPLSHGRGWNNFHESWKDNSHATTSYDELLRDTTGTLSSILNEIDIPFNPDRLLSAVERQSFDSRRKWTQEHGDSLNYGKEWQMRFLRYGKADAWGDYMHTLEKSAPELNAWRDYMHTLEESVLELNEFKTAEG